MSEPDRDDKRTVAPESHGDLAAAERKAARRMSLHGQKWTLTAAVIIWVAYLVLPHAAGVNGFEVTFALPAAREAGIKITEYIYALLIGLGIGVFTTLTLLTRRTTFGLVAWMLTTVGLFYSLLALWLRQTRSTSGDGYDIGPGMYLSIIGVALCVFAYARVALRRDPEQARIARARAEHHDLDEVGLAQRDALRAEQVTAEENPLFVDDRRQQAAQRHLATPRPQDPEQRQPRQR